ncbi:MAG: 30S ribosomal protein S13, partial [Thermoproteota archaeon]
MSSREFRAIIRIAGTDCDGSRRVDHAISSIKGIGPTLSKAIVKAAGIPLDARLGYLTESEIERIKEVTENPIAHGIPSWMVNRQRSPETGKDSHLIGSDLEIRTRMDIDAMKRTRSWKGLRHSLGLKVRGQRTKTTGREGRTLGVSRRAVAEAQKAKKEA